MKPYSDPTEQFLAVVCTPTHIKTLSDEHALRQYNCQAGVRVDPARPVVPTGSHRCLLYPLKTRMAILDPRRCKTHTTPVAGVINRPNTQF